MFPDIFSEDAFSLTALTAFINNLDYVPGRAGDLAFDGIGEGIPTDKVAQEWISDSLGLIPTTARGAPAPQEVQDKATMNAFTVPQVKLEDTINASQLLNARVPGTAAQLQTAQYVIEKQIIKMTRRHDLTLEHFRMGALTGIVRNSENAVLLNMYTFFGVAQPAIIDFSDVLNMTEEEGRVEALLTLCHQLHRTVTRSLKTAMPTSAYLHAFVGDDFFDRLVEITRKWHDGYAAAKRQLGDNYAFGMYEFGGIIWENYRGTDDNSTVAVGVNDARVFPVGVPGLYAEYYAPGDFLDVVGAAVGLPRYARIAPDGKFNRQVFLHTQANPIPLVTRPLALRQVTFTPVEESESA